MRITNMHAHFQATSFSKEDSSSSRAGKTTCHITLSNVEEEGIPQETSGNKRS